MQIEKPIARGRYDERPDPGIVCTEKVTKQSFKDDCDINKIIERIARGGPMPDRPQPLYGDFTNVPDFVEAFNIVQNAQNQFMSLDGKVRAKFNNNPEEFLAFATDSKNIDAMVEMGLATKRESPTPKEEVKTPPTPKEEVKTPPTPKETPNV